MPQPSLAPAAIHSAILARKGGRRSVRERISTRKSGRAVDRAAPFRQCQPIVAFLADPGGIGSPHGAAGQVEADVGAVAHAAVAAPPQRKVAPGFDFVACAFLGRHWHYNQFPFGRILKLPEFVVGGHPAKAFPEIGRAVVNAQCG